MTKTPAWRAGGSTTIHATCLKLARGGSAAGLLALSASSACTCPPCAAAATTSPACPEATGGNATNVAPAGASAAASADPRVAREVLWDGELVARGQGWANCDKPGEGCKATLAAALSEGTGNSNGLKLQGQGAGWQGGGWNWFGW
ncbi:MAG TPA: hypothetical protein VFZ61_29505, partial [Polyangiales bacterium]